MWNFLQVCGRAQLSRSFLLAVLLSVVLNAQASADWDYWIKRTRGKVATCAGSTGGNFIKLANADGRWVYIDGIATCKDVDQEYVFTIKFIRVRINSERVGDIVRDPINFDWLGLAAYRSVDAEQRIDWLYDEARPVRGTLAKQSSQPISFGGVEFRVPKTAMAQAQRLVFYLTAQGVPFEFEVL